MVPLGFPVLAARRLSPWPVALVRQAPLPRLLTFCRVGDAMVMVPVIGPAPARLDGFLGRLSRDQAVAAITDQVLSAGLTERFPHGKPTFWPKKLHQRPLHVAI